MSQDNPIERLKNSDLDLMPELIILGGIIEASPIINMKVLGILCNNILTVIWITKRSSMDNPHISGRLLQAIVIMIHTNQMRLLATTHA